MTFGEALEGHGLALTRGETVALQVNTGFRCNLACRHCHLEAGPERGEVMGPETMDAVVEAARRLRFGVIDVTGGSIEMVPGIERLVEGLSGLSARLIVRTNLSALHDMPDDRLLDLYRRAGAVVTASLPSLNAGQTDAQRGAGSWMKSIEMMRRLNSAGFGVPGSGLELDLAVNPAGAFLPQGQPETERRFRAELDRRHGITFDRLFAFANVPLGRYRDWLDRSGNAAGYRALLASRFNPCTVAGLMCRSQLSVDWRGMLYDCDFNLAAGLPHAGRARHIRELSELPPAGTPIPVGDHCFACTAGAGFTCGGAISA